MHNRYFAAGGIGAVLVALVAAAMWLLVPQPAKTEENAGPADAQAVLALRPDDIGMGDPNAPIKLIEYASSGCGHCAAFHIETVPRIKQDWVDKGLVYYVLRDFPLDGVAAAGSLLARCLPKERFYPFMDLLFRNQRVWHGPDVPDFRKALTDLAGQAGLSPEAVESCLKDQAALDRMQKERDLAVEILKVSSTPTSFVNGEIIEGAAAYSEFEAKFKALMPAQP
ncbi:MAG: DsbA family protein [Alphaproteobacteria bacterium]|nr:DsbA family protein [Alphaproteobacteria bacterium]